MKRDSGPCLGERREPAKKVSPLYSTGVRGGAISCSRVARFDTHEVGERIFFSALDKNEKNEISTAALFWFGLLLGVNE